MQLASEHHVGHERWLEDWSPEDRAKDFALRGWQAECCPSCGVHPSTWSPKHGGDIRNPELVPVWRKCQVCSVMAGMRTAGPPGEPKSPSGDYPGWYIQIVPREEAERERRSSD